MADTHMIFGRYPSNTTVQTMVHIPKLPLPAMVEPIDVDATQDNELDRIDKRIQMHLHGHCSPCRSPRKSTCEGILIKFPDGKCHRRFAQRQCIRLSAVMHTPSRAFASCS